MRSYHNKDLLENFVYIFHKVFIIQYNFLPSLL